MQGKIDNTKSNYETIVFGIPQGSTIGPLLFLLYINDLQNCSKKLSFRIFADVTNMFYTSDKLQHLETDKNEEFKLVFEYCIINKLSLNLAKTNYVLISSLRSNGSINLIHNIECKSQIKYQGVYIDQNLHWGPQIQHINNKLAKNVGFINKLRQLYFSFITHI